MDEKDLISVGEAAKMLNVSIDTLRRWDKIGKFRSIKSLGGHRRYSKIQINLFLNDLFGLAQEWVLRDFEVPSQFYCSNSAIFQARLIKMQDILSTNPELSDLYPLIVAVAGEIGNNSFDHNLGNWPNVPGIFFGYDLHKRRIALADRGLGVLATLKRVKPALDTDEKALEVAFTEILSGRSPENRGNGLKFVRQVVANNPISLIFQSGDAELEITKDGGGLLIHRSSFNFRGCLALIIF